MVQGNICIEHCCLVSVPNIWLIDQAGAVACHGTFTASSPASRTGVAFECDLPSSAVTVQARVFWQNSGLYSGAVLNQQHQRYAAQRRAAASVSATGQGSYHKASASAAESIRNFDAGFCNVPVLGLDGLQSTSLLSVLQDALTVHDSWYTATYGTHGTDGQVSVLSANQFGAGIAALLRSWNADSTCTTLDAAALAATGGGRRRRNAWPRTERGGEDQHAYIALGNALGFDWNNGDSCADEHVRHQNGAHALANDTVYGAGYGETAGAKCTCPVGPSTWAL